MPRRPVLGWTMARPAGLCTPRRSRSLARHAAVDLLHAVPQSVHPSESSLIAMVAQWWRAGQPRARTDTAKPRIFDHICRVVPGTVQSLPHNIRQPASPSQSCINSRLGGFAGRWQAHQRGPFCPLMAHCGSSHRSRSAELRSIRRFSAASEFAALEQILTRKAQAMNASLGLRPRMSGQSRDNSVFSSNARLESFN